MSSYVSQNNQSIAFQASCKYAPSNGLDTAKKDAENGVEKDFDSKIQKCLDITDEYVNHEPDAHCCNVPWQDLWKDVKKDLYWIDSAGGGESKERV